jgi:AraC-like DNA-binding protein
MVLVAPVSNPADAMTTGEIGWHRHRTTMVAIPKHGHYTEIVLRGRYHVTQGLVVITPAYVPHADKIGSKGALVKNLPLSVNVSVSGVFELPPVACRPEWPRDHYDLAGELRPVAAIRPDFWLSEAFEVLIASQSAAVAATQLGLSREHFHRCFIKAHAMTPGQALREHWLSGALSALSEDAPLAETAHDCGFADQSHMTRLVKVATGLTPRQFRASQITPVQE